MRVILLLLLSVAAGWAQTARLSDAQALAIGKRIWKNECAGTFSGLTSWNAGENFASLGIGHFIWYPEGAQGPFEESFPKLVRYLAGRGVKVPAWMGGACPWRTRAAFLADAQAPRMVELREILKETIGLQAQFAAARMEEALPKMLAAAPSGEREKIKWNFLRVAAAPMGFYALMDYVNFKGEGTSPTERYQGEGWGLLQVLEAMPSEGPALAQFAAAAKKVLDRRVKNAPPERHESKWLPGWKNRVETYAGN